MSSRDVHGGSGGFFNKASRRGSGAVGFSKYRGGSGAAAVTYIFLSSRSGAVAVELLERFLFFSK
jgi:hypothetical protein